jgi:hypothetical protein
MEKIIPGVMPLEERIKIIDRLLEAKTDEEYERIGNEFPIDPKTAKAALIAWGKEFILTCGLNFSRVEAELGLNWMDDTLKEFNDSLKEFGYVLPR